ncbi:hypothetical protein IM660_12365 [Ruania alkalisoli]|uniref:Uncharacterized protein n=1 Tax=Ruania alkalisoli TaxID=2779775 RepID=A0A7M1SPV8_9MICO|nr:DUF6297 family protein [Ruania alkalisoli]QOR69481.1 hypothetical protein IM660_12365 [Ruania alkalisoli]
MSEPITPGRLHPEQADPDDWPTGSQLRRLTRDATEAHTGGSFMEAIAEVYSVLFSMVIALAVALGAVQALNATLSTGPEQATLDPTWLSIVATLIVVGGIIGLAARLGPIGMGGGRATWWLTAPADRRGLLRPRFVLVPVLGGSVGAAGGALAMFLADGTGTQILWGVGAFAAGGALLAMATTAGQVLRGNRKERRVRPAVLVGDLLMAAGPVVGIVVALIRPPAPQVQNFTAWPVLVAVLAGLAVVLVWWAERNLEKIAGRELRARGAVSAYAGGAVTSMDTRELGRALSVVTAPDSRRRSASFPWVRGPVSAIVTGDATVFWRSPRHVIQVFVAASLGLLPVLAGWPIWLNLASLVVGGYLAAMATGEGARRAEMAPVLDRHFPISAFDVRRVRAIVPLTVMILWCVPIFGLWGAAHGHLVGWLIFGLLCAPTFAAGVIRAAYRKPPDWNKPLVNGPAGPVAPGVMLAFARGPDLVVLALIPLVIAAIAIGPAPILMMLQLSTSALGFVVATRVKDETKPSWMEQAQAEQERQQREKARRKGGR